MLSFSYGLSDGSERPLHAVTEAVHECSLDVPADSLRVCVKYDCGVRAHARSLIMRDGCALIFRKGEIVCKVPEDSAVDRMIEEMKETGLI